MKILGETISKSTPIDGGCISNCRKITTESGKRYVVKFYQKCGVAQAEATGLAELAKAKVNVPHVYDYSDNQLILGYIERAPLYASPQQLAASLAKVHAVTSAQFGFTSDNFIGSTEQANTPNNDWVHFFWENRILFQLQLAERNNRSTRELTIRLSKLENRLESILSGTEEPPTLLHGDLWRNNYFYDKYGQPVFIDPAVYYGHREADIAMTTLFGGFSEEFYNVYNEISPLKDDWRQRLNFYNIYHLLNHLHLFGTGYYNQLIESICYYV